MLRFNIKLVAITARLKLGGSSLSLHSGDARTPSCGRVRLTSTSTTACASCVPTRLCASVVAPPMCGVPMKPGQPSSGDDTGSGSVAKTSAA
eukprot:6187180-Pleurochrysis_carterae.AAC.1